MWRESSSSGYWASQSDVTGQLDQLYGLPGSKSSLSASYDSFYSALQTLRSDPSSTTQQSVLLSNAKILASKINALSDNIQSIRSGVEEEIGAATIEANQALSKLTDLNKRLGLSGGTPDPTLLDQRDEALASLSSLLDVNITIASDGTATVSTNNGNTLLDASGARTLSFDSRAPLAATSIYNALSTKRSVGTITLSGNGSGTIDLIAAGAFKTGRLGGLIDARDRTLVAAQAQLDDIAAGLASALSDTDVQVLRWLVVLISM
jgi:flagellar hook-associated protein 1 FlgK